MAIYLILDNKVHDAAKYAEYKKAVPAIIAKHGGEYLARDGKVEVPVGEWKPDRIVLFKWPSREALDAFQADPEYQPWKELRESCTTTNQVVIMNGL